MTDPKAYGRSLKLADTKTSLENLRIVDGCKVKVVDDWRGVMAIVVRPDGTEAGSSGWCGSYDGAADLLRRGGFLADYPIVDTRP
jgi:hypothetical protein